MQLHQHKEELDRLNVKVYIVSFDNFEMAKAYIANNSVEWPLIIDQDRVLYNTFMMGKATWWGLLNPYVVWKGFLSWWGGAEIQKVGSDVRQLGGDVMIDPQGVIRLHHNSTGPEDRPTVESLLNLARQG